MSATVSSPQQDTLLKENRLLRDVGATVQLDKLLGIFTEEIQQLEAIDGFLINLLDAEGKNLICEVVKLPETYRSFESTMKKYKFPLDSDYINAAAYRQNKTVSFDIDDVDTYDESAKARFDLWQIKQLVVTPIPSSDPSAETAIGTIMIFRQGDQVDQATINALTHLVEIFYHQINSARAHASIEAQREQVERAAAEQERFLHFITEINNLTSIKEIYQTISEEFLRRMPFEMCTVMMEEGGQLVHKKSAAVNETFQPLCDEWQTYLNSLRFDIKITEGATATVYINNTHLIFPDVMEILHMPMSEKDTKALALLKTPRTFFFMPIRYKGEPIGMIWLISISDTVTVNDADIKLTELLGGFIGTAMKNAKVYDLVAKQKQEIELLNDNLQGKVYELAEIASRDKLTGLHNFRSFEMELDRRIQDYQMSALDIDLSLILLDIDHFKNFNDKHGHAAGNAVLAGVANKLSALVRENDVACRYGGEEFVVILPKCTLEGAEIFAERIRSAIESAQFKTDTGTFSVTVSVGYGRHNDGESREALFERVDQALYRAKHRGRNRIEHAL